MKNAGAEFNSFETSNAPPFKTPLTQQYYKENQCLLIENDSVSERKKSKAIKYLKTI